ncbi:Tify domain binding domain [Dillenia turbinata]|uniref:Ninja-family protein n=1 Tax=Dillenia turbinata TaxID=194707 RepID=A0AAN8VCI5_9MAGN
MAAEGNNNNQPQPRPPRLVIDLTSRRVHQPIPNPEDVDLGLDFNIGSPIGQGPQNDNSPVLTPSSSSSSAESEVVSMDESDSKAVNGSPPLMTSPASPPMARASTSVLARRLLAAIGMQRPRRTRSPTYPPMTPERAAIQNPGLYRAFLRMQEEGMVPPSLPMHGRNNMNSARIPLAMPRLQIGSRSPEIRSTEVGAAEHTMTQQSSNMALPRNRRLFFDAESSARRNNSGIDAVDMMPSVTTVGNGPLGRRIEGFLYKFSSPEEVKLVCNCHGRVFSPAGFYKHAGGTDVPNPSRLRMGIR